MACFNSDLSLDMKTCPYNSGHKVKASRYQAHISKCAKQRNQTDISQHKISVCPFNRNHCIPEHEFADHLLKCRDNSQHMRNIIAAKQEKPVVAIEPMINTASKSDVWFNDKKMCDLEIGSNQALLRDEITAEELLDITEKSGTFVNSIYLSRMSNAERKKFYAMLSERTRNRSQVIDGNESDELNGPTSGESSKRAKSDANDESMIGVKVETTTFRAPKTRMPFRLQTPMNDEQYDESEERVCRGRGRAVNALTGTNVAQSLGIGRGLLRR